MAPPRERALLTGRTTRFWAAAGQLGGDFQGRGGAGNYREEGSPTAADGRGLLWGGKLQ